jgi:LysM repeat protein
VDDIMRENNLANSIVHPGQVLKLAVPVAYLSQ